MRVRHRRFPFSDKKLKEFVDHVELSPDHLLIPAANVSAGARSLLAKVEKLDAALKSLDVEAYLGEESLWKALEALLHAIRKCLSAAGRRVKE